MVWGQIVSFYKLGREPLPDTDCICCCLLLGWFSLLKCEKCLHYLVCFVIAAYYELQLYSLVKMLHWWATSESLTTGSLFKPLAVRVPACMQVCRPAFSLTVLEYCYLSVEQQQASWAAVLRGSSFSPSPLPKQACLKVHCLNSCQGLATYTFFSALVINLRN